MTNNKAIAIVGMGAILPDAFNVESFWGNITQKKYSIREVPENRWKADYYFNPDPKATDKTYSKIGAWVQGYKFDPFQAHIAIPPRVLAVMDEAQQWAIAACLQALQDFGYPQRPLNPERVAVILGNAMAGENHYRSSLRICAPEYIGALESLPEFQSLPATIQAALRDGMHSKVQAIIPDITEDTMPGELSNIIAGRVANVFNFSGPNFVTDAACASSLAAIETAMEGLNNHKFDAVLTGGVDRNMGPESFVKFSKIGALSPDGSRPYADGANGFVMGEGAVIFLMKRLEDAETQGDTIYAVVRGVGGSSDGKGKGITAPNPLGQQRAIERGWKDAGLDPKTVGLIEGHGTSTKVGDVTEVASLNAVLGNIGLPIGSVALGSVKSNIGHLKSAAGAAGVLKVVLGLYNKTLPPSANFDRPNPNIEFDKLPFRVNTNSTPWEVNPGEVRRAGVSSFGFGGTNFHVVLEEYIPGMLLKQNELHIMPAITENKTMPSPQAIPEPVMTASQSVGIPQSSTGTLMEEEVRTYVLQAVSEKTGYPPEMLDMDLDLEADLGVDTVKQAELFATIRTHYGIPRKEDLRLSDYNTLAKVVGFVLDAGGQTIVPVALSDAPSGHSQDVVYETAPVLPETASTTPVELQPYQGLCFLSSDSHGELTEKVQKVLADANTGKLPESVCPSPEALGKSERLAIDYADSAELIKRLEKAYSALTNEKPGVWPALKAQGIYRGSGKPGKVAFLFPGQGSQYVNMLKDLHESEPVVVETFDEADRVMTPILGKPLTSYIYVDGDEESIAQAEKNLKDTTITQPAMLTANVALLRVLTKYGIQPDVVIGHSLGEYAALVAAGVLSFPEALQVVSARGREMAKVSMADNGCMAAISAPLEKVDEILRTIQGYVVIANINSPVQSVIGGATAAVDEALAAFQAAGFQAVKIPVSHAFHTRIVEPASIPMMQVIDRMNVQSPQIPVIANVTGSLYPTERAEIVSILGEQVASPVQMVKTMQTLYEMGVRIYVEAGPKRVLNALATDNLKDKKDVTILATNHPRKGGKASFNEALCGLYAAGVGGKVIQDTQPVHQTQAVAETMPVLVQGKPVATLTGSVVVTGAGLGLPGRNKKVFDDQNIQRIMSGEMMIEPLDTDAREAMLEKRVTRLVKSEAGAVMQEITDVEQTLKLSGQRGEFDLVRDFGVPEERVDSLDISTQLAIAAGIDALRDAGIPLVMNYRKTSKGTLLPDRLKLPEPLQDETGIVFCSAFPGLDRMAEESDRFTRHQTMTKQLEEIHSIKDLILQMNPSGQTQLLNDLERREMKLEEEIKTLNYHFDRRYVFRILSMGHSQFAEYIGARGPNTHVNAACATTTHGIAIAEDWIRSGRCRRVIVIAGDDVTNPNLVSWIGTSLFASGAATTEGNVRMAALPFDRRRNGMIMGMGAAALVIESEDAARERGVRAICEILSSQIANSAYHGTRLDIGHVSEVMNRLVHVAEDRFHLDRRNAAGKMVFISHETYTPARGGSASAEIHALRNTFKENADQVVIANTKGFTGHAMGVGIEDVIAVKSLELNMVPPIAHIQEGFEPDPELGNLNLSKGGKYPIEYALRLGAGFGSQIAMTLYRKVPGEGSRIHSTQYQQWLNAVTGYSATDLEVVQRTLRVRNQGVPQNSPIQNEWSFGLLPSTWAQGYPQNGNGKSIQPLPAAPKPVEVTKPIEAAPHSVAETIATSDEEVKAYVLSAVSEKTGYPVEMLDLDLDLEADLGVDTVKQAELFATIRTNYGIPRKEDLRLSDYNTLTKVIGFVTSNRPGQSSTMMTTPEAKTAETVADLPIAITPQTTEVTQEAADVPSVETDAIKAHVLSAVSEKTGYPTEMLDLELDLEADLGIDTVKQAELFASIRTHYGIPRREDLRLSDYNTLQKVIEFVQSGLAVQQAISVPVEVAPAVPEEKTDHVSEKTPDIQLRRRVPVPVLRPRLDLCLPTGIELNEKSQVVIVAQSGKLTDALSKLLEKSGVKVRVCDPKDAAEKISIYQDQQAIDGVYFLAAEESSNNSDAAESLFHTVRAVPDLKFLVAATRMGGFFGFDGVCDRPLDGLVSGFVKTAGQERNSMLAKVVDLDSKLSIKLQADRLLGETLFDPGVTEIGMEGALRFGITLHDVEIHPSQKPLNQGSTFVISGGTAGIVAPIVMDLVQATRGTFYLLGRTNLIDPSDPRLDLLRNHPDALRKEIAEALNQAGQKSTPVLIEQRISSLQKAAGMHDLIRKVQQAGGKAHYLVCDATSHEQVNQAIQFIAEGSQRVDVFIHAAGLEKSRKMETKPLEEFKGIISAKVDSFQNILQELKSHQRVPGRVVAFSSVAGRFGNSGQVDYSAANDALCKMMYSLPVDYKETQFLSIDWGAWSDVGMASKGNMPHLMSLAGIEMISPDQAAPLVRMELEAGTTGEVMLAGSLGQMESSLENKPGVDIDKSDQALREGNPIHSMLSHLKAYGADGVIRLEADLDPREQPFLKDHALNGVPVLPGVMGIEGFAVAAKHIASVLALSKGKFEVVTMEDIHFHAPFKFYRNQPRHITWKAYCSREAEGLVVYVNLESELEFKVRKPEKVLHFSGKVRITEEKVAKSQAVTPPAWLKKKSLCSDDIYKLYFHGPSFQVLDCAQKSGDVVLGKLRANLLPITTGKQQTISTPLLVELCFQTAGLWEAGSTGVMALPHSIESLTLFRAENQTGDIYAEVRPNRDGDELSFDARVVDSDGNVYLELKNYRTVALPYAAEKQLVEPLQVLLN